jgi:transposase
VIAKEMLRILEGDIRNGFENIVTGDETWLPFYIPSLAKWMPRGSKPEEIIKLQSPKEKVMVTVFWGTNGFYIVKPLQKGKTINASYFQHEILEPLSKIYPTTTKKTKHYLHMDNASSHKAGASLQLASDLGFTLMPQPPFSPDIAPSDFYLFGRVKREMKGFRHQSAEEAVMAFETILNKIKIQERLDAMTEWMKRVEKVIASGGEYIH